MLVVICVLCGIYSNNVKAINQSDVTSKLNSLINQYEGEIWNKNFAGGSQCYAFAHFVFDTLFDRGERQVGNGAVSSNSTCYKLKNVAEDITTIGILDPGYSFDSLENLLEKTAPGDYIQVKRNNTGGPHSMIAVGVNSSNNTIEIFDANSEGNGKVKHYTQDFSYFMQRNAGVSVYRYSGYDPVQAPPANPQISRSQVWYDLGDTIEISAYADNATDYYMSMYKDDRKIVEKSVPGGRFSMSAKQEGEGHYSVYFSCSNSLGSVDTNWLDFDVVGAASYSDVSTARAIYDLTDTVSISVSSVCAKGQEIGIDKEGVGRVITQACDSTYSIPASELGIGTYSAYFSVYNGSGGVDTSRVSFQIVDGSTSAPSNPKISMSQNWYDLEDTIEVSAQADNATDYYMSMYKDDVKIVEQSVAGGKFSMPAKQYGEGRYSFYFSCSNKKGSVDTHWLDFDVVGAASYSAVSTEKEIYDLSDIVSISVTTIYAKGQEIGIDKEGVGRVITKASGSTYSIPAAELGVGKYSAYFSVYNGSGGVDTNSVSFQIVDKSESGNPQISLSEGYAREGDIVDVYINLSDNPGIVGMTLAVEYDSKVLQLLSCEDLGILNDYQWSNIDRNPFLLNWEDPLAQENNMASGNIAKLQFKVLSNPGEEGTELKLSIDTAYDVNIEDVNFSAVNGRIMLKKYTPGDVNEDGAINSKDSILVRKYVLGHSVNMNLEAADVNHDGIVNSKDSITLRKYVLGGNVILK